MTFLGPSVATKELNEVKALRSLILDAVEISSPDTPRRAGSAVALQGSWWIEDVAAATRFEFL